MLNVRVLQIAALLVVAAGCASSRARVTPLDAGARFPVRYHVTLDPRPFSSANMSAASRELATRTSAPVDGPSVTLTWQILRMPHDVAHAALGEGGAALSALAVDRVEADRVREWLLAQDDVTSLANPVLTLQDTQRGSLTVFSQVTFVSGFSVEEHDGDLIADPEIDVAQDGLLVLVRPTLKQPGGLAILEIDLVDASLEQPVRCEELHLPGSDEIVQVQRPSCLIQRLTTRAEIPLGGTLVLGAHPAGSTDDVIVCFVGVDSP